MKTLQSLLFTLLAWTSLAQTPLSDSSDKAKWNAKLFLGTNSALIPIGSKVVFGLGKHPMSDHVAELRITGYSEDGKHCIATEDPKGEEWHPAFVSQLSIAEFSARLRHVVVLCNTNLEVDGRAELYHETNLVKTVRIPYQKPGRRHFFISGFEAGGTNAPSIDWDHVNR